MCHSKKRIAALGPRVQTEPHGRPFRSGRGAASRCETRRRSLSVAEAACAAPSRLGGRRRPADRIQSASFDHDGGAVPRRHQARPRRFRRRYQRASHVAGGLPRPVCARGAGAGAALRSRNRSFRVAARDRDRERGAQLWRRSALSWHRDHRRVFVFSRRVEPGRRQARFSPSHRPDDGLLHHAGLRRAGFVGGDGSAVSACARRKLGAGAGDLGAAGTRRRARRLASAVCARRRHPCRHATRS